MNYLIQAYACSPDRGGEFGVSWELLKRLDGRVHRGDNIYVVSLTLTQKNIDTSSLRNVKLIHVKGMKMWSWLIKYPVYYWIWQRAAYFSCLKTNLNFDVIHVYSLSDFRQPGIWYRFADAHTIFGPVGGGQETPPSLTSYDSMSGKLRNIVNSYCQHSFFFRKKIRKYDSVFACNPETLAMLPNSRFATDVPLSAKFENLPIFQSANKTPIIIFCGRFIQKKGISLLVDVVEYLVYTLRFTEFSVELYGDGPLKEATIELIHTKRLDKYMNVCSPVSHEQISHVYAHGDIFVMPSLRESGGNVLVEAMAHRLPVVSLRMGLSSIFAKESTGLFVNVNQSTDGLIREFAKNVKNLSQDSGLRKRLGENGYNFVNSTLTWDSLMSTVYPNL
jgi:glycosyltransferase involved in cell wall biosynthesis